MFQSPGGGGGSGRRSNSPSRRPQLLALRAVLARTTRPAGPIARTRPAGASRQPDCAEPTSATVRISQGASSKNTERRLPEHGGREGVP
jgi:hypothetical protein